ncbi:MAG: DNA-processing protein DprA [Myxococcota bacterium]
MDRISPFWAGARKLAGRVDLCAVSEAAGGWAALSQSSVSDLVDLGVGEHVARHWLGFDAESTMGVALTLADPAYPPRLAVLPDAPPVLCVEGDPLALRSLAVAVVGTRNCTPYGAAVARHLGSAVARRGGVVVSGLARGIDGHAHRASLGGGRTVAVLGHGLPITSPSTHRDLRRRIVHQGGAIVTGFPDEQRPTRWTFPMRNRWIAALADVTVVVEAPFKSGALITATEAASMGRPVFAVPGALGQAHSGGCLALLEQGAQVLSDVEAFADRVLGACAQPEDPFLDALCDGPTPDVLAQRLGMPLLDVLGKLAHLEVEGLVVRLPGQHYAPMRDPS